MFHYPLVHWTTFLTAVFLLNIAPGPDMAFILGQTASNGRRKGFAAMIGIWSGTFIHVILAALGLSAILAASAVAFSVVKWAGAIYLVWLGIKALRSRDSSFLSDKETQGASARSVYFQGMAVSALNPKVAIFFLAFLPQFVVAGSGPVSAQLFLHGVLIIVVASFIEPFIVLGGSWLTDRLRANERIGVWLDRSLGALLIGLGVRLAFSD